MALEDDREHRSPSRRNAGYTGQPGMVDPRPALAIGALVLILIAVLVIML